MYFMLPWSALSYLCRRDGALVFEEALVDVLHAAMERCLTCVDEMGRLSLKRRLLMYFMLPWSAVLPV